MTTSTNPSPDADKPGVTAAELRDRIVGMAWNDTPEDVARVILASGIPADRWFEEMRRQGFNARDIEDVRSRLPKPRTPSAPELQARVAVLEAALLELRDAANESHAPGERGVQGRLRALAAIGRTNALLRKPEQQVGGAA